MQFTYYTFPDFFFFQISTDLRTKQLFKQSLGKACLSSLQPHKFATLFMKSPVYNKISKGVGGRKKLFLTGILFADSVKGSWIFKNK